MWDVARQCGPTKRLLGLDELAPEQRVVIKQACLDGRLRTDIAEEQGISYDTVGSHCRLGLEELDRRRRAAMFYAAGERKHVRWHAGATSLDGLTHSHIPDRWTGFGVEYRAVALFSVWTLVAGLVRAAVMVWGWAPARAALGPVPPLSGWPRLAHHLDQVLLLTWPAGLAAAGRRGVPAARPARCAPRHRARVRRGGGPARRDLPGQPARARPRLHRLGQRVQASASTSKVRRSSLAQSTCGDVASSRPPSRRSTRRTEMPCGVTFTSPGVIDVLASGGRSRG